MIWIAHLIDNSFIRPQPDHIRRLGIDASLELAAFALWEGALARKDDIRARLEQEFDICAEIDVYWSERYYHQNIRRLYERVNNSSQLDSDVGRNLSKKIGSPPFRLIVVRDNDPSYTFKQSVSGIIEPTNVRVHRLKYEFRRMFSESYQVHSTNNMSEFLTQISLILGTTSLEKLLSGEKLAEREVHRDLSGAQGWRDLGEMLDVLNYSQEYVVLRNFAALPDELTDTDLDLLCSDYQKAASAMNLNQKPERPYKGTVLVNNQPLKVDLRFIGDGYYDAQWAKKILTDRHLNKGFYRPGTVDYFFSLFYHAKVHKSTVKQEYKVELAEIAEALGFDWFTETTLARDDESAFALSGYMNAQGYIYQPCMDPGVHSHLPVASHLPSTRFTPSRKRGLGGRVKTLRKSITAKLKSVVGR